MDALSERSNDFHRLTTGLGRSKRDLPACGLDIAETLGHASQIRLDLSLRIFDNPGRALSERHCA
jgi:hypothetical protein